METFLSISFKPTRTCLKYSTWLRIWGHMTSEYILLTSLLDPMWKIFYSELQTRHKSKFSAQKHGWWQSCWQDPSLDFIHQQHIPHSQSIFTLFNSQFYVCFFLICVYNCWNKRYWCCIDVWEFKFVHPLMSLVET